MSTEINFEPDPSGTAVREWRERDGAPGPTPRIRRYPEGNSNAYAASVVIVGSAANLISLVCENSNAGTMYLHVFDATSLPLAGATPILPPVQIPAHKTGSYDFQEAGFPFENGIVAALSSTEKTLTVAVAADGIFTATYRV